VGRGSQRRIQTVAEVKGIGPDGDYDLVTLSDAENNS
jgi:hypothetical protein